MSKIIIVEDDADLRSILRDNLEVFGDHELFEAEDGLIALRMIPEVQPDLILLDVVMPNLDGFGVLKARQKDPDWLNIPVLMLTAVSDSKTVVKALEMGASDYIKKPFVSEELMARVQTHLGWKQARDELRARDQRLKIELEMAKETQERLHPKPKFLKSIENHGFRIFIFQRAASEISGDLVHLQNFEECGFALTVADCKGHGVAAALMTMATSAFLSGIRDPNIGPGEAFTKLNLDLIGLIPIHEPVVGIQLRYRREKGLFLSRAAFSYPLLYRCATEEVVQIKEGNIPLGYTPHEYIETERILEQGDKLLVFSDGMSEETNEQGEPFSLTRSRFGENLVIHGQKPAEMCGQSIITAWEDFRYGKQRDDATLVILEKI